MFTKATLVHCIIHTLLVAFLAASLCLNMAFYKGAIYLDYDVLKRINPPVK